MVKPVCIYKTLLLIVSKRGIGVFARGENSYGNYFVIWGLCCGRFSVLMVPLLTLIGGICEVKT